MKPFISNTDNRPYMNVMFGNFYSPAYDDEHFVDETMALIRRLGYNSVMFDTKAWEDFKERCETGALSQYVKMQEYMGESAHRHGLAYNFLLLYLNGDNLYPHIRYSPPIFGEETVYLDGRPGHWYKYWSDKARRSMKAHVERIMERYGSGCERCVAAPTTLSGAAPGRCPGAPAGCGAAPEGADGAAAECGAASGTCPGAPDSMSAPAMASGADAPVVPVCSMWDPVVAPSFDEEGQCCYRSFLKNYYHGDIGELNRRYGIYAESFEALTPQQYWFNVKYEQDFCFAEADVRGRTPKFYLWRDNMMWKIHELTLYFKAIGPMLKEKNPQLFLCPDMSQWGYFLNIYGRSQQDLDNEFSDLWDTALRGIDMYALAPYVDSCHFITVPVTPDGYPDAYVVSCQHSMMRVMNEGKPVIGGIYWGRYIYNDIYALLSPAEIIGSMVACGIDGYHCYGMNGLDDGGVMNRMDEPFLNSLALANDWCSEVILARRGPRKKEIALLFPSEMAHLEPFEVGNNKIRRLDLLGWYKYCCDLGYQVDVISGHEINRGALKDYKVLIVPANDCYFAVEHEQMEENIRAWVRQGGVLLHGPMDELAENCFGIHGEACQKQPYRCGSVIIPQGEAFCRYHGGEVIAPYVGAAEAKPEAAGAGAPEIDQAAGGADGESGAAAKAVGGALAGGGAPEGDQAAAAVDSESGVAAKAAGGALAGAVSGDDNGGVCVAGYDGQWLADHVDAGKDGRWQGAVYSFGVQIGASYAAKNIPHVPYDQGNKEMYPIIQSQTTLVKDILNRHIKPASGICERGIETGVFQTGMVIVNHRSTPYVLPEKYLTEKYQYPHHAARADGCGILGGHEAVWVSNE